MVDKVLALYLDAPMQSWGHQSRFDRRASLSYPTRSGVFGMICAALGIDREDVNGLQRLDPLKMTVLRFGEPSRLEDFHTVGGGYDKKEEAQHIVRTAEGNVGKTVVTHREYLEDARFGVLLEGDSALIEEIAGALNDPVWGIWLGRKCCIPASPVCQGVFAKKEEAENHLRHLEESRRSDESGSTPVAVRRYSEVEDFESGTDALMDRPLDFGSRRYALRRVAEENI